VSATARRLIGREDELGAIAHLVEASSAAEVNQLCRLAGLGHVRIVRAVET